MAPSDLCDPTRYTLMGTEHAATDIGLELLGETEKLHAHTHVHTHTPRPAFLPWRQVILTFEPNTHTPSNLILVVGRQTHPVM